MGRILPRLLMKRLGARQFGPRRKFYVASVRTPPLRALEELVDARRVTPPDR